MCAKLEADEQVRLNGHYFLAVKGCIKMEQLRSSAHTLELIIFQQTLNCNSYSKQ